MSSVGVECRGFSIVGSPEKKELCSGADLRRNNYVQEPTSEEIIMFRSRPKKEELCSGADLRRKNHVQEPTSEGRIRSRSRPQKK